MLLRSLYRAARARAARPTAAWDGSGTAGSCRTRADRPTPHPHPPDHRDRVRAGRARQGAPPTAGPRDPLCHIDRGAPDLAHRWHAPLPLRGQLRAPGRCPAHFLLLGQAKPASPEPRAATRQLHHALHIIAISRPQHDLRRLRDGWGARSPLGAAWLIARPKPCHKPCTRQPDLASANLVKV
jgi:hypothetical protein